jgi:hypothetical protein
MKRFITALLICAPLANVCESGQAAEATAVSAVHLSPIPGVSFNLPNGWIACDDASNHLLGDAHDQFRLRRGMCVVHPGWEKASSAFFHAFNPDIYPPIEVLVGQLDANRMRLLSCDDLKREMLGRDLVLTHCDADNTMFAGQPAVHMRAISKPLKDDIHLYIQVDSYQLQNLSVRTVTPLQYLSDARPQPELDQIIASFQIAG